MRKWTFIVIVAGLVVFTGCEEAVMQVRGLGDHETAIVMPGMVCKGGGEVGARIQWYEADVAGGGNETVGIGAYGAVPVDANSLSAFGLGGDWEVPLGAEVRVGGFLAGDIEESGVSVGPMVLIDRPITDRLSASVLYEFEMFDDNLSDVGYEDNSRVYAGATVRF